MLALRHTRTYARSATPSIERSEHVAPARITPGSNSSSRGPYNPGPPNTLKHLMTENIRGFDTDAWDTRPVVR